MKEARAMVPEGIDPGSLEGTQWIGNYLRSQGFLVNLLDLHSCINRSLRTSINDSAR